MIVGIVVASYVSFDLNMNNNVLAEVERPGCFDLLRHLSFSRVDAKAPFRAKWPTRFSSGSACSVSLLTGRRWWANTRLTGTSPCIR